MGKSEHSHALCTAYLHCTASLHLSYTLQAEYLFSVHLPAQKVRKSEHTHDLCTACAKCIETMLHIITNTLQPDENVLKSLRSRGLAKILKVLCCVKAAALCKLCHAHRPSHIACCQTVMLG